jgi:hypothetical protein
MKIVTWLVSFVLFASATVALAADPPGVVSYAKKGAFADVKQDVADGIIKQGFVIDQTSKIGEMLTRTAKDVGAKKEVFISAEALQFCPAKLSRDLFEANPTMIAFCPHVLVVYELAGSPGVVHVAYRKMPNGRTKAERSAQQAVTKALDGIARAATH